MKRISLRPARLPALSFSAAYAGGPFLLDDASMDRVTAAGEVFFNTDIDKPSTSSRRQLRHHQERCDQCRSRRFAGLGRGIRRFDWMGLQPRRDRDLRAGHHRGAFSFSDALAAGNFFPEPPIVTPPTAE